MAEREIYTSVPEIADYNPSSVTIKLGERDGKVLASTYSTIDAFTRIANGEVAPNEKVRGDQVKEYDTAEFNDKYGKDHITFDQFHDDARRAQNILSHRDQYMVGDDDINLNNARDFVDRYEELKVDWNNFRNDYSTENPAVQLNQQSLPSLGR